MDQLDLFGPTPAPKGKQPDARESSHSVSLDSAFRRTAEYERHIRSAQWRNTREYMFKLRGKKCERCDSTTDLELHHKTYERFGRELPRDLEILCKLHHAAADREREETLAQEFEELCENSRYENAKHTFLTKVYGEFYYPTEEMERRFDEWLEKKRLDEWCG